ncbi:MAG: TonB-dependent receptor [Parvularculaceae bacterium]|nr:TonB-dependent receptor [Parvularculaceae bacterium]
MTSRRTYAATASSLAIAVGMALLPQASAQESDDDVIVVTATRRAESLQNVPINIAAVTGDQIEEQGFDELADTLAYVPGINIVDRGGRQGNPIIVRGLNADPLGSGDGNNNGGGTVSTYIGDIPFFIDLKLNDIERVEVLLGPQGTLYGAGTLGGAIRFLPKRPQFTEDSFTIRSEVFQYGEADSISTDVGFTFNKRLSDTLALRGSMDLRNDSGFIDYPFVVQEIGVSEPDPDFNDPAALAANFDPVEDANSEDTLSGRLALRWAPIDAVDANLTYYYQKADIGGRQLSSARSTVPAGQYEAGLRVREPNEIENQLLALEVTADLGFAELTSASGFSKFEDDGQRDQTDLLISLEYSYETFPTFTGFTREVGKEERINQELRLVSTADSRLTWIVGAFYNAFESWGSSSEFTPFYGAFAGLSERPDNLEYFSQGITELEESAFFGELGFDITDQLTVTVGGRYYEYDLETFDRVDFPLFDDDFVPRTLDEIRDDLKSDEDASTGGQDDNGTLFKFNVSYQPTTDLLLYGTVSEGYRIGNSNGVGTCDAFDPDDNQQGACALLPGQQFGPGPNDFSSRDETQYFADQTTNYELGVKSTVMDGALQLNGAVYFIEWTDPQVSSATVNASIPITVNADGAESKGVEVSFNYSGIENLSVRGSYGYVDATLTAPVPDLIRGITPPGFATEFEDGESGDRLPGIPESQFSLFTTYEQELGSGRAIRYNFGYAWQDEVLTRAGGRGDSLTLDAFGIADASVVYDAGQWTASLFVDNVFDEFAETGVRGTELFNQTVEGASVRTFGTFVAPPRSIGVRFRYDFE